MRHLVVIKLLLNKDNRERGVTLVEVVLVFVIIGIMAAISVPNMLEEQRRQRVNETFNRIRGVLTEAQVNANRLSKSCTVTIALSPLNPSLLLVSGTPVGCVLEPFTVDTGIVSVRDGNDFTTATPPSATTSIEKTFTYTGTTNNAGTLWLARANDTTGNTAKCIVVSSIGMIRTGVYDDTATTSPKCVNAENTFYQQ